MEELDQLIEEQTPEVAKAINNLIERAGTSDADWNVLLEAGNMIAELRNPLDDAKMNEEEKRLSESGSHFGDIAVHSTKLDDNTEAFNELYLTQRIDAAIALLVNNGYRVEKILRSDESFALSK